MKVLVTGHAGYVGRIMVPMLIQRGHEVTGLDAFLYEDDPFGSPETLPANELRADIRDVRAEDLVGYDAVVFLAALCNDALGNLDPELTYRINHRATVDFAGAAKEAGVPRFLFSSSCSLYGAGGDAAVDEDAGFSPLTPYGETKIMVEQDLTHLADDDFTPTYLRNATVYGASPALRLDLVVNDLVAHAVTSGKVLIKSDGTPWRPLVHVEDVARAFAAALDAPRETVHDRAFNVGDDDANLQVRQIAELVRDRVPGSEIEIGSEASPDARSYRVSFSRIRRELPDAAPHWTVATGIDQLRDAYVRQGLSPADMAAGRYMRIRRILALREAGQLADDLRWNVAGARS